MIDWAARERIVDFVLGNRGWFFRRVVGRERVGFVVDVALAAAGIVLRKHVVGIEHFPLVSYRPDSILYTEKYALELEFGAK